MSVYKKTDYRFKILYAVGMIMVVCGHAEGGGINLFFDWFHYTGMHLALFMFCSGYFYRRESENSLCGYILKKVKKLIIPLYIYNLFYALFVQIMRHFGFIIGNTLTLCDLLIAPITNGHQFVYNMAGWFVIPLFIVETYNILIRVILRKVKNDISEWVFFLIALFAGLGGNQMACIGNNNGWWLVLVRMLYFVPFYELGILYREKLESIDRKISSFWYFSFLLVFKLATICYLGKLPMYTPSWCSDFIDGPLMPIITGYLGIAFWLRIAILMEPAIGRSKWLNLVADNTYSIMMNHFVGFMLVKGVYAGCNKFLGVFQDFDWIRFKTDIWYLYIPGGIGNTRIIYLFAGIAFPVLVQLFINRIKITPSLVAAQIRKTG